VSDREGGPREKGEGLEVVVFKKRSNMERGKGKDRLLSGKGEGDVKRGKGSRGGYTCHAFGRGKDMPGGVHSPCGEFREKKEGGVGKKKLQNLSGEKRGKESRE